jgi:formylmethanofuran dehydrogenase subunit E
MVGVELVLEPGEMLKCDYCGDSLYEGKVRFIYDVLGYKVVCSDCLEDEKG